jgi:hypothetical protein
MGEPTWLDSVVAAAMIVVSLYCVGRLVAAHRWDRQAAYDVNVSHVLMGVAMAGMFVPSLDVFPRPAWIGIFTAMTLWFFVQSATSGIRWRVDATAGRSFSHQVFHLVMASSMLYMYDPISSWSLVASSSSVSSSSSSMDGMTMSSGSGDAALSLLFVTVLLGSAAWQAASPVAAHATAVNITTIGSTMAVAGGTATATPPPLAPRLELSCHLCMCVAMAYMLILTV